MSIEKISAQSILEKDLNYTTLCSQTIRSIITHGSAEAAGLWTWAMTQSSQFELRREHVCAALSIGREKFQRIMQELEKLGLAVLSPGTRDAQGQVHGKKWKIFALSTIEKNGTQCLNVERKITYTVNKPEATDERVFRPTANPAKISNNQKPSNNKNKYKNIGYAQTAFARFWGEYPKKLDRKRAEDEFIAYCATRALNQHEIDSLATELLTSLNARIKSGLWNDIKYIPYAKRFISERLWIEPIPNPNGRLAVSIAAGIPPSEHFAQPDDYGPRIITCDEYPCGEEYDDLLRAAVEPIFDEHGNEIPPFKLAA